MPSKSPAQHRLMEGIAHGMKPRKGGPSKAVAEEFVAADAGKSFGKRDRREHKHPRNHDEFIALGADKPVSRKGAPSTGQRGGNSGN